MLTARSLARHLGGLQHDPAKFVRGGVRYSRKRAATALAWWSLTRRGYLDFVASRPDGAYRPDYADLWFLYQEIRDQKPQVILEFGSGCSTVILAQALQDNAAAGAPTGRILSLETSAEWVQVTRDSIPKHLAHICSVEHSSLSVVAFKGTPAFVHDARPDLVPDFVYLDGPALTDSVRCAGDAVEMEETLKPGFRMVVDGRVENVAFLRRTLRRRYRITERPLFFNTVFELLE